MATFGDTTQEGTALTTAAGALVLGLYTSPADAGTGTDIVVACKSASTTQTCYAVLYADASGAPGALLGSGTISPVSGTATFYDASGLSITLAPNTNYWIGFFNPAGNTNKSVQVAATGGTSYQVVAGGATPPSTAPSGGTAGTRKISAYVTYTPSGGGGSAPTNTAAPVVSGTTAQGSTLSCTTGTWTDSPTSYAYQWYQDDLFNPLIPISGATGSTYVLQSTDVGYYIQCQVVATNGVGSSSPAVSNEVGPIAGTGYTLHSSAFTYLGSDGVTNWPVDVYDPATPNGYALILVHGGQWDSNDRTVMAIEGAFFANLGYRCFAGDFVQEQGGVDATIDRQHMIDDVGLMVAACRANGTWNTGMTRFFGLGESSGGHLLYMVACTKTGNQKPDAVVGWSPITRFDSPTIQALPTPWGAIKGYLDDNAPSTALLQQFSPYNQVTAACCPMRIAGSNTEQIPKEQFDDMLAAAQAVAINVVEQTYAGGTHARLTNLDGAATDTWLRSVPPATGTVPTVTLSAPTGSATGGATASGTIGTLTLSAPTGSASGSGGATATGGIGTVVLSAPTATATGGAGAGGSIGTIVLSPATGSATGGAGASGGIPTLTISPPQASATGAANASGGIGVLTLIRPTGTATGTGVQFGPVPEPTTTITEPSATSVLVDP